MRNYDLYVRDILDAMETIGHFIEGMDFEAFQRDEKTVSAVIQKLEVIGEAAKQIPEDLRQKAPTVPWQEMAGMRNKLIHFYFGVDRQLVWWAARERIPAVKPEIEKLL